MIGFASSSVVSFLDSINSLLAIGSFDGDIQEKIDGYMYGGIAEYSIRSVLSIILSFCSGAFFIWLYHYFGNHYFSKASSVQEEYRNNMYHTLLNLYIFGMYFDCRKKWVIDTFQQIMQNMSFWRGRNCTIF